MSDQNAGSDSEPMEACDAFLEDRASPEQRLIIQRFRQQMASDAPEARLRMRGGTEKYYAVPVYRVVRDIVAISPNKLGVAFSFTQGARLDDPHNLLDGSGKRSRTVRISKVSDYPETDLPHLIRQAVALDQA
jgi:hypothetical protein